MLVAGFRKWWVKEILACCWLNSMLSKPPRESRLSVANERGNHPDDPDKRNPIDSVFCVAAKPAGRRDDPLFAGYHGINSEPCRAWEMTRRRRYARLISEKIKCSPYLFI
jgi:hypothetical protein